MNRKELQELQSIREYPSVSILAPTHRTAPDNRQDPIRVKNLVSEATSRLIEEYSKRDIEPLLERLEYLVDEIDWRYVQDGLALFVNKDFAARFDLPFPVQQRVLIDETFATRDLVFALNRSARYLVLTLSEQSTRLFSAVRDRLEEISDDVFPMEQTGPGADEPLPGGAGVRKSAYRDEYDRKFFRQVDTALTETLKEDPLPVVIVGVVRNLAFFDEVTANKNSVVARVEGNHDRTPAHEIGKLVWPVMQQAMAERRTSVLHELSEATGARRAAFGIGEAWQLAQQGRAATLIVEEDFHYPAIVHSSGLLLPPDKDTPDAEYLGDAVDDLIEVVLEKGGQVVFVENGALEEHNSVAMILRY